MKAVRKFIFHSIMSEDNETFIRKPIDYFLIMLIISNTIAVIVETVPSIDARYHDSFVLFELFSVTIFSIEYLCRLYSCIEDQRYEGKVSGRIKFILTPMQIIDALAILPFFLSFAGVDARILRALRIMRIFRLLKIARYIESVDTISDVLKEKSVDIIVSLVMIGILVIISASFMYFAEREIQPDVFSSIPAAMWWAVATLTTVGYGDIYPVTPLGKILASFISILGIGAIAVPTGILSSAFSDMMRKSK